MKTHLTPEMTLEVLASAKDNGDEFVIVAFKIDGTTRFWTRNGLPWKHDGLEVAKDLADWAATREGFVRALVWNCYNGHVSDVLYTAVQ